MNPEPPGVAPVALIIDDEPQIRRLLRVTLEASGYRVLDAATGQEGLVQAAQRRPDVILLDLGLPDLERVEVKLTPIEYAPLRLLVVHAGKVLTQGQLLREVWGPNAAGQSHYLRVHIAHLRAKLEADPSAPELIITEPAVGYRLVLKG